MLKAPLYFQMVVLLVVPRILQTKSFKIEEGKKRIPQLIDVDFKTYF